jgi:hypothetical protein
VKIEKEAFSAQLFAEILPLAKKCWDESTKAKGETCAFYGERDFDIEPDREAYQQLSDRGSLVIVTVRDNGILKGYVVGFSYRGLHHQKIKGGIGDSIYLEPEYRSYFAVVADKFENELKALGVQIIGWPVTPDGPIHEVLKARGYVGDDIVMEKRLCA